jgi:hypothetical protein
MSAYTASQAGIRLYGPGKFYTILDSYVYQLEPDETESYEDGGGWYGLFRGPIDPDSLELDEGDILTAAEREACLNTVGVVLWERSDGIVESSWNDDADELEKAWSELVAEFAELNEDD